VDKQLLSEFSLDITNSLDTSLSTKIQITKDISIPISVNKDSLGKSLSVSVNENSLITHVYLNQNNVSINFLDLIKDKAKFLKLTHKDNISEFDKNYKFYKYKDSKGT